MVTQRARADIQPVTWEIPAAGTLCWLMLSLALLPAGQGAAGWLFAGGFVWPADQPSLMSSIGGLLTGRPGQGLLPADAEHLASTPSIYLLIGLCEIALMALTVWVLVAWWRHMGPGKQQGMASRVEVEKVLGMSNLRKKRKVIRPDLYGATRGGERGSA